MSDWETKYKCTKCQHLSSITEAICPKCDDRKTMTGNFNIRFEGWEKLVVRQNREKFVWYKPNTWKNVRN
ncbi:hypothetical protein ACM26V_07830 [Salipaludibacillus sp. HK11]|uniref:hypothetical protein n=1 Tax=Salipaludibacillus sp. HK11 TaxID=3394320 RepID=UPI0039FB96DA